MVNIVGVLLSLRDIVAILAIIKTKKWGVNKNH